jgi:hypothetical protein
MEEITTDIPMLTILSVLHHDKYTWPRSRLPRVRFSAIPIFFFKKSEILLLLIFNDSATWWRGQWLENVDQIHLVLASAKSSSTNIKVYN